MWGKNDFPSNLLIVDDSVETLGILQQTFRHSEFDIITATSGEEALNLLHSAGIPQLAIVDVHMPPGMTGLDFAEQVLQYLDFPIIMLTAVENEAVIVEAIERYAEDYVLKPFNPGELMARVHSILNRIGRFPYPAGPLVSVDPHLQVYFARRRLIYAGQRSKIMTPTETKLLHILLRRVGETVTSDFLLRRMWPREIVDDDRLHVHIHRLRGKLREVQGGEDHDYIISERGVGFCFQPAEPSVIS